MAARNKAIAIQAAPDLVKLVYEQYQKGILVDDPDNPGYVYWPKTILTRKRVDGKSVSSRRLVGLTTTTRERATSWLDVKKAGQDASGLLRKTIETADAKREMSTSVQAMENPMFDDDDYFRYQYSKAPYGGARSIPAARRNPSDWNMKFKAITARAREILNADPECKWGTAFQQARAELEGRANKNPKEKKTDLNASMWRAHFGRIGERAFAILSAKPKCDWKTAWDKARREIEGGAGARKAANNPWYPDGLYLPDTTQVKSVLERAPYQWSDETMVVSALEGGRYGRNNPYDETPYLEGPYREDHHPVYEQFIGQFGTGERFTHGIVPYGRRNGRKGSR